MSEAPTIPTFKLVLGKHSLRSAGLVNFNVLLRFLSLLSSH
jgi:hypothetical protein